MTRYLTEFLGTFALMATIGCAVILPMSAATAALLIGAVLVGLVYSGARHSGAHYNPAVTLSLCLRGDCRVAEVAPYWAAQAAGAGLAGWAVMKFLGDAVALTIPNKPLAVGAEFLFTFALVFVILVVGGRSYGGVAIGGVVAIGAFAVGGLSGGAFNPAVALGLAVVNRVASIHLWIHLVGAFAGAVAATLVFRGLRRAKS